MELKDEYGYIFLELYEEDGEIRLRSYDTYTDGAPSLTKTQAIDLAKELLRIAEEI